MQILAGAALLAVAYFGGRYFLIRVIGKELAKSHRRSFP